MKVKRLVVIALAALALLVSGCTLYAEKNPLKGTKSEDGVTASFADGVMHGLTAPMMLFVSLVDRNTEIYEVKNDGTWYNMGYLFGIWLSFKMVLSWQDGQEEEEEEEEETDE